MSQIKEIAAYWGTRAQGYSERCKIDLIEDTKFDWLDKICKYAPAKQQLNVLDIGCGLFSILMAKAGHNVTSIDYTENMARSLHSSGASHRSMRHCLPPPLPFV